MSRCICGKGFTGDKQLKQHQADTGHKAPTISELPDPEVKSLEGDELIVVLYEALYKANEHLDYCGYGDSWERECAGDLPDQITEALKVVPAKFKE